MIAGRAAIHRYLVTAGPAHLLLSAVPLGAGRCHISCPSGPQQQTRRSSVRRPQDGTDRQTDRRTGGLNV